MFTMFNMFMPYQLSILTLLHFQGIKHQHLFYSGIGDDTRSWAPPWKGSESAYFLSINRNKQSVCVNMKVKEGNEIIKKVSLRSLVV